MNTTISVSVEVRDKIREFGDKGSRTLIFWKGYTRAQRKGNCMISCSMRKILSMYARGDCVSAETMAKVIITKGLEEEVNKEVQRPIS